MAAAPDTVTRTTSLAELRTASQPREANMPVVRAGFNDLAGFELAQRAAKALSQSTLVPKEYQNNLPNCVVALELAQRIGASPLMVMQNLDIVHGRPTWRAQFVISCINQCGRFTALQYEWSGKPDTDAWTCRAWAKDKATGERVQGPAISIAMAKKEGWFQKSGSKWQTIPELMLMYRAGAWFGRTNAPELTMGLNTTEEARDIIDIEPERITTEEVRERPAAAEPSGKAPKADNGSPYNDEVHALLAIDAAKDRDEANAVVDACRDTPFYQQVVAGYNKKWAEVVE